MVEGYSWKMFIKHIGTLLLGPLITYIIYMYINVVLYICLFLFMFKSLETSVLCLLNKLKLTLHYINLYLFMLSL